MPWASLKGEPLHRSPWTQLQFFGGSLTLRSHNGATFQHPALNQQPEWLSSVRVRGPGNDLRVRWVLFGRFVCKQWEKVGGEGDSLGVGWVVLTGQKARKKLINCLCSVPWERCWVRWFVKTNLIFQTTRCPCTKLILCQAGPIRRKINKDIWCHQCGNKQGQSQTAAQLGLRHELWAPTVQLVLQRGEKRALEEKNSRCYKHSPTALLVLILPSNERLNLYGGWVSTDQQSLHRTKALPSPGLALKWGEADSKHGTNPFPTPNPRKEAIEPTREFPHSFHLLHGAARCGGYVRPSSWEESAQKTHRGGAKMGKAQCRLSAASIQCHCRNFLNSMMYFLK